MSNDCGKHNFVTFSRAIQGIYSQQYLDTAPFFKNILASRHYTNSNFSMLIYNGDTDAVCNFLGCQWFVERLVKDLGIPVTSTISYWNPPMLRQ